MWVIEYSKGGGSSLPLVLVTASEAYYNHYKDDENNFVFLIGHTNNLIRKIPTENMVDLLSRLTYDGDSGDFDKVITEAIILAGGCICLTDEEGWW